MNRKTILLAVLLTFLIVSAGCPPATEAATLTATMTVNYEIANPDVFWNTLIKTCNYLPGIKPDYVLCQVRELNASNVQTIRLTKANPKGQLKLTTTSGNWVEISAVAYRNIDSFPYPFYDVGCPHIANNGSTVTVTLTVNGASPALVTMDTKR